MDGEWQIQLEMLLLERNNCVATVGWEEAREDRQACWWVCVSRRGVRPEGVPGFEILISRGAESLVRAIGLAEDFCGPNIERKVSCE